MNTATTFPNPLAGFLDYLVGLFAPKPQLAYFEEGDDEPPESSDEAFQRRGRELEEALFNDDEELPPEKEPEDEDEDDEDDDDDDDDDEDDPEKDDDDDDDDEDDPEKDDEDFDYEDEDDPEKDDEDDPEKDDEEPEDETHARRLAKENGRKVKELETEVTELGLERDRLKADLDEAQGQLTDFERVTVDPKSTPQYNELNDKIWGSVDEASMTLPDSASGFPNRFQDYVRTYIKAGRLEAGEKRNDAVRALRDDLTQEFGGMTAALTEEEQEDPTRIQEKAVEKKSADEVVQTLMGILRDNAPKVRELFDLENSIRDKSKTGRLAMGVKDYERKTGRTQGALDSVGTLTPELMKEDPFSLEAVTTRISQKDQAGRDKLARAKADVVEVMNGLRPLTQEEIGKVEESGTDLKVFLKEREAKHLKKLNRLGPLFVRALMTAAVTKTSLRELADLKNEEEEVDNELEALRRTGKKRKVRKAKKVKEPQGPASERPLAIEEEFD